MTDNNIINNFDAEFDPLNLNKEVFDSVDNDNVQKFCLFNVHTRKIQPSELDIKLNNERDCYKNIFRASIKNKGNDINENIPNNSITCPSKYNPNWHINDSLPSDWNGTDFPICQTNDDSYCYIDKSPCDMIKIGFDTNEHNLLANECKINVDFNVNDIRVPENIETHIDDVQNNSDKNKSYKIIKINNKIKIHINDVILDKKIFVDAETITEHTGTNLNTPANGPNSHNTFVKICYNDKDIIINNINIDTIVTIYNELSDMY